jgi:hypothetical protein
MQHQLTQNQLVRRLILHTSYYNRFNFKIALLPASSSSFYNFLIRLQSGISVNLLQLDATPKWHFCEEPPAAFSQNPALNRGFLNM